MAQIGLRGESLLRQCQAGTDEQAYVARTANEEIATQLKGLLPPMLRSLFSPSTTMTELVPYMMRIISPPLRPVSLQTRVARPS